MHSQTKCSRLANNLGNGIHMKTLKKKKKRMDWCCNACDEPLPNEDAVIAHYRREHKEDGWGLWNICGKTGDAFADTTVNHLWQRLKDEGVKLQAAQSKAEAYDKLLERWNALCRALQIGNSAMEAYRDAYEKTKP